MESAAERQIHSHNEFVWLAWSNAALTARATNDPKNFPSLQSLELPSRQTVRRPRQSPEEQRQMLRLFAQIHGALKN